MKAWSKKSLNKALDKIHVYEVELRKREGINLKYKGGSMKIKTKYIIIVGECNEFEIEYTEEQAPQRIGRNIESIFINGDNRKIRVYGGPNPIDSGTLLHLITHLCDELVRLKEVIR